MRSGLFAAVLFGAVGCGGGAEPAAPTNLLLVLLDTTRADHLSCYGYDVETTPTIDALARGGVRFDGAFAQSSLTPVSAGTLLSGAMPYRHGVRSLFVVGKQAMSSDVASLFELLGASGRRTAGFVSAKPMGRQYGLARGFAEYDDDLSATRERYRIARFGDAPQRPGDETTDLALAWLERNGREPFALMVHLFDPHDPSFVPPPEFLAEHLSFEIPTEHGRVVLPGRFPAGRGMSRWIELYDAELRFTDDQVARLLAALDELGVRGETLVAVVADHGESFGEHDFHTHGLLYREQLHVPLILNGPGLPSGLVVEDRVRLVDFLPTIAELMSLGTPDEALDGRSMVPLIAGETEEARELYAEVHHAANDSRGRETEMYAITVGGWKYVHRPASGTHELFDLERDPHETRNLYSADHPQAQALRHRIESLGAVDGVVPTTEGMSPEAIEELRRLGYL